MNTEKKGSMNVDTALAIVYSKVLGFDQSCLESGKKNQVASQYRVMGV